MLSLCGEPEGATQLEHHHRFQAVVMAWKFMEENGPVRDLLHPWRLSSLAKRLCGLESAQLPQAQIKKLDTFQLRGRRKMLKITTTFMIRENTNDNCVIDCEYQGSQKDENSSSQRNIRAQKTTITFTTNQKR
jgi:hypothetical protein